MPHPRKRWLGSWRPYRWQKVWFFDSLQSCAQTLSFPEAMKFWMWKLSFAKSGTHWRTCETGRKIPKIKNREQARKKDNTLRVATFAELCHFMKSELEKEIPNIKGRAVLRVAGSCAEFIEQGFSVSHHSVGRYCFISLAKRATQYQRTGGRSRLIEIAKIRLSSSLDTSNTFLMSSIFGYSARFLWNFFERHVYWHPRAGLLLERQYETFWFEENLDKVLWCECLLLQRENGFFLFVNVEERRNTWSSCLKTNFEEPPLLDQEQLGCTKPDSRTYMRIVEEDRILLESFIASRHGKNNARLGADPQRHYLLVVRYDMEGQAKKFVECLESNERSEQWHIVPNPCLDDHPFLMRKNWRQLENFSEDRTGSWWYK